MIIENHLQFFIFAYANWRKRIVLETAVLENHRFRVNVHIEQGSPIATSEKHVREMNLLKPHFYIVEYLKSVNIPSSWGQCLCASLADVCLCNRWKGAKMFQRVNYLHL